MFVKYLNGVKNLKIMFDMIKDLQLEYKKSF